MKSKILRLNLIYKLQNYLLYYFYYAYKCSSFLKTEIIYSIGSQPIIKDLL